MDVCTVIYICIYIFRELTGWTCAEPCPQFSHFSIFFVYQVGDQIVAVDGADMRGVLARDIRPRLVKRLVNTFVF